MSINLQQFMTTFFTKAESADSGIESVSKSDNIECPGSLTDDISEKEVLLTNVKKQVKQLMEEFVSRKYVHEYSSNVIQLCATIESCLLLGLKRRALGLFKESSSLALLEKISKQNPIAKSICLKMTEERRHFSDSLSDMSFGSSMTNSSLSSKSEFSFGSTVGHSMSAASFLGFGSRKIFFGGNQSGENEIASLHLKNLRKLYWIRLALTEKVLDKIVDYLVKNSGRFYNRDSIIGDPCDGYILVSLLSGPCSLEYSRLKNPDFILEDPDAGELIQRQKIQNQTGSTGIEAGKSPKLSHALSTSSLFWSSGSTQNLNKPALIVKMPTADFDAGSRSPCSAAKLYVESLHQSANSTLLYGKNNVYSQPRDDMSKMPGYLSLHLAVSDLLIKWTPNELMSGGLNSVCHEGSVKVEWDSAVIIWVTKIVYIHCHRQVDKGETMILVNKDGSQNPPFEFPKGGHLISFLTCLENGLLPRCRLDPPVFTKVSRVKLDTLFGNVDEIKMIESTGPLSADMFKSKRPSSQVFLWSTGDSGECRFSWLPKPFSNSFTFGKRKLLSDPIEHLVVDKTKEDRSNLSCDDWPADMIFRIVRPKNYSTDDSYSDIGTDCGEDDMDGVDDIFKSNQRFSNCSELPQWHAEYTYRALHRRCGSSNEKRSSRSSIRRLCCSMKKEILARSFYGWLAYCRHMRTIRSHLSQLILPSNIENIHLISEYKKGLQKAIWDRHLRMDEEFEDPKQMLNYLYWGGCSTDIRTEVWPYILTVYQWHDSGKQRRKTLRKWEKRYEIAVSEWMAIESVIDDQMRDDKSPVDEDDDTCAVEIEKEPEKVANEYEELANLAATTKEQWQKQDKIIVTKRMMNRIKQNLTRIEKDVTRCDRHFEYFGQSKLGEANLDILQRIMCAWVWENFEIGYIQGMCDLLAPLLVTFKGNEEITYACFSKYMERMINNFPVKDSNKMDLNFSRMRSAVQILDADLLEHMQSHGDFTHFYFSYRWFLLDFKREFTYESVYCLWEVIWAADEICSSNFSLFIGLALLLSYRDIIIDNGMEFTDIIRFFNEMAEQHDVQKVLDLARELVEKLQVLLHS